MRNLAPIAVCAALAAAVLAAGAAAAYRDPCPQAGFRPVHLVAADGARVYAVEAGSGPTGVVLAHQYLSDHCELVYFARDLARRGFRALALDFRGYGGSRGGDPARLDLDVAAAAARLRAEGARRVELVGASMGGTAVLVAASRIRPAVAGVVSLSGPASFHGLDALRAVRRSHVPVRFLVGRDDVRFAADAQALARAAAARDRALRRYPGGFHGSSLLDQPRPRRDVLAFLGG